MTGGAKAHDDGIVAFSQTDFVEDLKKVPLLVMNSEDDHYPLRRCGIPVGNAAEERAFQGGFISKDLNLALAGGTT